MPSLKVLIAASPDHTQRYQQAVKNAGYHCSFPFQKGSNSFPILEELLSIPFDLLILPGGGDISPGLYRQTNNGSYTADHNLDLLQFQLLQLAVLHKKPVLGICKGAQIINVFFGGTLCQQLPTVTLHSSPMHDCYHSLFFSSDFDPADNSLHGKICDLLSLHPHVNSSHHQGICQLGKHICCMQYAKDYVPETIVHDSLPILGVQWHPERLPDFCSSSFAQLIEILTDRRQQTSLCS